MGEIATVDNIDMSALLHLIEFTDSAFPIGTFSFSNTLESAAEHGLVYDVSTLGTYTHTMIRQAAFTDGIIALHAMRYSKTEYMDGILLSDRQAILCRANAESRKMTCRMGHRFAELSKHIVIDDMCNRWLRLIEDNKTPGTYPVAQGIVFAACGIDEQPLFCSYIYGVANTILSAALRCIRVSHYDTQRILFGIGNKIHSLYDNIRDANFNDIHSFNPQADILASLHEKGDRRLFMN